MPTQWALAELIEWRCGFGDQVDGRPRAAGVPQEE
jgi:hypothetical protein